MNKSDIAIKVDQISKVYRIGLREEISDSFLKTSLNFIKKPIDNYRKYRSLYHFDDIGNIPNGEEHSSDLGILWALHKISFDVKKGEVIGIIGSNGAGKSTLLKILCNITKPTSGQAEIWGRVSSLLEVGTGFHPELTGRENIYLNGTILGMKKWEIDEKFSDIVSFSGVKKFIDTPVKRYSTGMKVRLAFAVAAHLEPEILIIDEVLAVGDADFQRKCLKKMDEVGKSGRTVLFVSHNLNAVARLCSRSILLEKGKLIDEGPSNEVISTYLNAEKGISSSRQWKETETAPGGAIARLRSVRVVPESGEDVDYIKINESFVLEMSYDVLLDEHILLPNFHVYNDHGVEAFTVIDTDPEWRRKERPSGRYISSVEVPGNLMSEGLFTVRAALVTLEPNIVQFNESSVIAFTIVDSQNGETARGDYAGNISGVMRPLLNWRTDYSSLNS